MLSKFADNRRWRNNGEMNEETWARIQRQNEGALRETPDDAMFRWLAMSYAHSHPTMTETYRGSCNGDDVTGGQGIVNRASWKPVVGSKCWPNRPQRNGHRKNTIREDTHVHKRATSLKSPQISLQTHVVEHLLLSSLNQVLCTHCAD